jgi:hypothetical protein
VPESVFVCALAGRGIAAIAAPITATTRSDPATIGARPPAGNAVADAITPTVPW